MMTNLTCQKMIVVSDVHIGNPFSNCRKDLMEFLKWAAKEKYDICINGDGLDIAQSSFSSLAIEVPEVFLALKEISKSGINVYYVVGNHDMALEHFLEDWGFFKVCPFLNLESGNARIRIEHGHLYDPFFVKFPTVYEVLTRAAGVLLAINANLYRLWIWLEHLNSKFRLKFNGISGEPLEFELSALEITRRGFDAVIFGHTHYKGEVILDNGKRYLNSGSWLISYDYIEIINGELKILQWNR
jgi:UDP-2,3-diacylglucosamine pyrophosphatase LpxH